MSDSDGHGPILQKDTPFSEWQSNAKAYMQRKEVFTAVCIELDSPEISICLVLDSPSGPSQIIVSPLRPYLVVVPAQAVLAQISSSWPRSEAPSRPYLPVLPLSSSLQPTLFPPRSISLYEHGQLPLKDILNCVGFSESTFYRVLYLWRTTGDVVRHTIKNPGRSRLLHHDDIQYLLRLVRHSPDWFLDELLRLLEHNRFISVHYTTIHHELEHAGMSTKKLKVIAMERSEPTRMNYIREAAEYPPEYLGFLDETSKNDKTPARR
ncbi:hypothetical protein B0H17DRAFT_1178656 [Mycena rosella]|uniref:Uncharacterized protein n=1 Tax=Mycena rosella TaxID=1033263 RepID=A0AAD7DM81_MYCRO|nr:hypothetical protein B0H17DRAFT_1178656 [Mycena rosella]